MQKGWVGEDVWEMLGLFLGKLANSVVVNPPVRIDLGEVKERF